MILPISGQPLIDPKDLQDRSKNAADRPRGVHLLNDIERNGDIRVGGNDLAVGGDGISGLRREKKDDLQLDSVGKDDLKHIPFDHASTLNTIFNSSTLNTTWDGSIVGSPSSVGFVIDGIDPREERRSSSDIRSANGDTRSQDGRRSYDNLEDRVSSIEQLDETDDKFVDPSLVRLLDGIGTRQMSNQNGQADPRDKSLRYYGTDYLDTQAYRDTQQYRDAQEYRDRQSVDSSDEFETTQTGRLSFVPNPLDITTSDVDVDMMESPTKPSNSLNALDNQRNTLDNQRNTSDFDSFHTLDGIASNVPEKLVAIKDPSNWALRRNDMGHKQSWNEMVDDEFTERTGASKSNSMLDGSTVDGLKNKEPESTKTDLNQ